jgi:antitoxin (DNA-binding transcriptional repressor) of toxin-antitoxin stability system
VPGINIRQLRDTRRLKAWLSAGQTVELRERGRVIARIVPQASLPQRAAVPDFSAIRKEIFGTALSLERICSLKSVGGFEHLHSYHFLIRFICPISIQNKPRTCFK